MKKNINLTTIILIAVLTAFYFLTHFANLTLLPVFADEAIYIRWSQLIIDDPGRYLFFPLNDGKTPLQMWLITPLQLVLNDPLFAGRFLSVFVGFFQILSIGKLTQLLGGRKKTILLSMVLTTILPFWYFHHRMALTDPLMTLFVTLSFIFTIKIVNNKTFSKLSLGNLIKSFSQNKRWIILSGISIGLGFWSKLPIILTLPAIVLLTFLPEKKSISHYAISLVNIFLSILIGLLIFASLKIHPAFGQLFARGSDFLYPLSDVLSGMWKTTILNIPSYLIYFYTYLTLPILFFMLYGLFSPTMKRQQWWLFLATLSFFLPIAIMGKVVYPRYFLPIAIFFTLSTSLAIQEVTDLYITNQKNLKVKAFFSLIIALIISNIFITSAAFIIPSLTNTGLIPFTSADKTQYLTEWSSGHGITQTVEYIQNQARDHSIAVATEGYFGTLPDAILMYLHGQNVENIYVEGIGQPVLLIPSTFLQRASQFDQVVLVVNSHRMGLNLDKSKLISQYCRPFNAPCLQIWDITDLIAKINP